MNKPSGRKERFKPEVARVVAASLGKGMGKAV
jgi:hypothetical protein